MDNIELQNMVENLLLEIQQITESDSHTLVPYHWPKNEQTDMVIEALVEKLSTIGSLTRKARRLLRD